MPTCAQSLQARSGHPRVGVLHRDDYTCHLGRNERVEFWFGMGVQLFYIAQVYSYWRAERAAPTEIDSTRQATLRKPEDFRLAISYNPTNSWYYVGLAESLERENLKDKELLQEVEQALRAAILRAPAHWSHHLKLGQFYLKYYQFDPRAKLPLAIKELGAAVALFPESGFLHLQLGLGLAWMERHYKGFLPSEYLGLSGFHLEKAYKLDVRLDPGLVGLLNQKK